MDKTTARRDGDTIVVERGGKRLVRLCLKTEQVIESSDPATAAAVRTMKRGPGGVATPD